MSWKRLIIKGEQITKEWTRRGSYYILVKKLDMSKDIRKQMKPVHDEFKEINTKRGEYAPKKIIADVLSEIYHVTSFHIKSILIKDEKNDIYVILYYPIEDWLAKFDEIVDDTEALVQLMKINIGVGAE